LAELRASHQRAREMLAEGKYELAWRRIPRSFRCGPGQRWDRKWNGQPHDELGRVDFGKQPKPDSELILARAPVPFPLRAPVVSPPPKGVENALRAYAAASNWNSSERRAVLGFNARAFEPGATAGNDAVHV